MSTNHIRDMRAALQRHIDEMRACKTDDLIFAWPYGLGVKIDADGKPTACKLVDATPIERSGPHFYARIENGHGKPARVVRRQTALELHISETIELLGNPALRSC